MRPWMAVLGGLVLMVGLTRCAGEDPDVRRGNMFYQNGKYAEAAEAYNKAVERNPKVLDVATTREQYKKAYYYYGGSLEMNGGLDAAMKYYEKGFAVDPSDSGICDKIAKYYWKDEDWEKCAHYFGRLVELDGQLPENDQKFRILGQDYYALGYSQYQMKKFPEAVEALAQSLKVSPKGDMAGKAQSALDAAKLGMKKK